MTTSNYSIVEYIQRLRKANFSEEQAETLAKETEQLISSVLEQAHKDVEKKDLEVAKNQIILWVAGLFVASGLIQHFFK